MYHLYKYTHRKSGKSYIGATMDLERRHKEHAHGRSKARAFNSAVKKYGIDAFDFRILAILDNEDEAARTEQAAIKTFRTLKPNGYNLKAGAPFTKYSGSQSEETRVKISVAWHANPKRRKQLVKLNSARKGVPQSPENRKKATAARLASPKWREQVAKSNAIPEHMKQITELGAARKGVPHSSETRRKISAAKMGKPRKGHPTSPETRSKISAALTGKTLSSEHRQKLSTAKKGNPWSTARRAAEINRKGVSHEPQNSV